jgi:hypothetical protein
LCASSITDLAAMSTYPSLHFSTQVFRSDVVPWTTHHGGNFADLVLDLRPVDTAPLQMREEAVRGPDALGGVVNGAAETLVHDAVRQV